MLVAERQVGLKWIKKCPKWAYFTISELERFGIDIDIDKEYSCCFGIINLLYFPSLLSMSLVLMELKALRNDTSVEFSEGRSGILIVKLIVLCLYTVHSLHSSCLFYLFLFPEFFFYILFWVSRAAFSPEWSHQIQTFKCAVQCWFKVVLLKNNIYSL